MFTLMLGIIGVGLQKAEDPTSKAIGTAVIGASVFLTVQKLSKAVEG